MRLIATQALSSLVGKEVKKFLISAFPTSLFTNEPLSLPVLETNNLKRASSLFISIEYLKVLCSSLC